MTYINQKVIAQLHRLGRNAKVLERSEDGKNEFGNTTETHSFSHTVMAVKTYPNRNTEHESRVGDYEQDRPVFIVAIGDDLPDPPGEDDRIVYDGDKYEVKAFTKYETHVEFFGDQVLHEP